MKAESTDTNTLLDRKRILHNLDREFDAEVRLESEKRMAKALVLANDNDSLREALHWIHVLTIVGVHPTYASQAWVAYQYRAKLPSLETHP